MEKIFKNFRVIDSSKDELLDVYVVDGMIKEVGKNLDYDCQVIEGDKRVLLPSFTDLHAHFRDPGFLYKEDLETGSRAALKGGFTSVNLMGNTNPICDNMEVYTYVKDKAKKLDLIDVEQVITITKGFDGKTLDHLDEIDDTVKFISDDGHGVYSDLVMYQAMLKAKEKNIALTLHEEQKDFSSFDYRLAEDLHTIRDVYLAGKTGAKVHFSHVSTKDSIEAIRQGKKNGIEVTCEVTPHHILLSNSDYRVNPPIRTDEDIRAIIEAIKDGTVDAIATDHAPHSEEDKAKGSPGMVGLESAFPIAYTTLVGKNKVSIHKLVEIMSERPARILGHKKGIVEEGYQADFAIVDLDKEYKFVEDEIESKSHNSPFIDMVFKGMILETYRLGELKYRR